MALLNIFDIAGSALTAQSQRLNVAASNLANADSVTGPDGQPYRAKQVVFQVNAAPGAATGGVSGVALLGTAGTGNFGTLTNGALEASNVDLSKELVNMIVAQRNYQSNAQTIKTQDQILNTRVNLR
ncbi:flagellar basal body rod C-terminal domain-containing protein [Shigella flexneri]